MAVLTLRPAATQVDWEIIKGEDFTITVPVLDANDIVQDVSTWIGKAQVRRGERDPLLHEWSVAQANLTMTADGVVLAVIGIATSLWEWDTAQVSIEVTDPDSKTRVIADGRIHALPEITQ